MSFEFKGTADDFNPSEGGSQPTQPYIGKARLVDVNEDNPSQDENKPEYDVLQFHFEILEGEEKGTVYRHIEWEPNNADKAKNIFKRVGHILSQYIKGDKEEAKEKAAKALQANSWGEFKEKVLTLFNERMGKQKYQKKEVNIKLLGWVLKQGKNAGNTDYGFPGYIGFISDSRSEKKLTFGRQEQKNNAEYLEALQAAPDTAGTGGGSPEAPAGEPGEEEEDEALEF